MPRVLGEGVDRDGLQRRRQLQVQRFDMHEQLCLGPERRDDRLLREAPAGELRPQCVVLLRGLVGEVRLLVDVALVLELHRSEAPGPLHEQGLAPQRRVARQRLVLLEAGQVYDEVHQGVVVGQVHRQHRVCQQRAEHVAVIPALLHQLLQHGGAVGAVRGVLHLVRLHPAEAGLEDTRQALRVEGEARTCHLAHLLHGLHAGFPGGLDASINEREGGVVARVVLPRRRLLAHEDILEEGVRRQLHVEIVLNVALEVGDLCLLARDRRGALAEGLVLRAAVAAEGRLGANEVLQGQVEETVHEGQLNPLESTDEIHPGERHVREEIQDVDGAEGLLHRAHLAKHNPEVADALPVVPLRRHVVEGREDGLEELAVQEHGRVRHAHEVVEHQQRVVAGLDRLATPVLGRHHVLRSPVRNALHGSDHVQADELEGLARRLGAELAVGDLQRLLASAVHGADAEATEPVENEAVWVELPPLVRRILVLVVGTRGGVQGRAVLPARVADNI
mmetsp:Transcript_11017/g.28458  ORF Transcript_11017/g.28458 Transcript_11017/m.28458 type:complete len:506 (-) Transcript_11017:488-2005(-)